MVCSVATILIPVYVQLYDSIREKDLDTVVECLPYMTAAFNATVRLLTVHLNRKDFGTMYDLVKDEWRLLISKDELRMLDKVTKQGYLIAHVYRSTLLTCLVVYLSIPLVSPLLDVVLPLNDSRSREQIVQLNYIIFDNKEHFYLTYIHLAWCSTIVVIIIVSVDSMYMITAHHNCGLFIICGYQIRQAVKNIIVCAKNSTMDNNAYEKFKHCVEAHNKAIQFYEILERCNRINMFIVVGLNMIGISATAYQVVTCIDDPEHALRYTAFFLAEQFHLYFASIPGQMLVERSLEIIYDIYGSEWYYTPRKIQLILHTMQMRSGKSCALTAGGLYHLDMENFAIAFKTCMSYFTMLLSLKE